MVEVFVHSDAGGRTTLSELLRVHEWAGTKEFFGLYAYAAYSGVVTFGRLFGRDFWNRVPSRWLLGIDYGRTQPSALRYVIGRANTAVRIYDGARTVEREGFAPSRGFHLKTAFLLNEEDTRFGMVVGSGNLSSNGLRRSVECGATVRAMTMPKFRATLRPALEVAENMWQTATPAEDIIDTYEDRWKAALPGKTVDLGTDPDFENIDMFWIEAGYVTRNRGPDKPGNQIDMPRGMSRYFGYEVTPGLAPKSVIGPITFEPPSGGSVTRNLRLGGNMMEKITLPVPETHGLDMYDGKVLVFSAQVGGFAIQAFEAGDFDAAFKHRVAHVRMMGSGRRYGHIV